MGCVTGDQVCVRVASKLGSEFLHNGEFPLNFHASEENKQYGEEASDSKMTASAEINRIMTCTVDTLVSEIETRNKRLKGLNAKFGLLMDVAAVINIDDLESLWKHCADFAATYEGDIDGSCLMHETIDCSMRFRNRQCLEAEKPQTPQQLLKATI